MTTSLTFQGEDPNETVIFVLRRHPWTLFRPGFIVVILLLCITAALIIFQGSWVTSWTIFILGPLSLYLAFRAWFLWINSVYVLTDQRVVAVDQTSWFDRQVGELAVADIMKIGHEVRGASATLFNFGDVNIIASGATASDLTLAAVYDPYEIQQRIVRAKKGQVDRSDDPAVDRTTASS